MRTDTEIKLDGTKALIKAMGTVEAERYIALIARERFDYTTWRKKNIIEDDIAAVSKAAMKLRKKTAQKS